MNHIPVTIASVYSQPNKKLTYQEFSTLIESFTNTYIMGGDFNAKHPLWGSITTNNRGRTLHKIIIDKKLNGYPPYLQPTGQQIQTKIQIYWTFLLPTYLIISNPILKTQIFSHLTTRQYF